MLKKLINGEVVYTTQEEWDRYQKYIEQRENGPSTSGYDLPVITGVNPLSYWFPYRDSVGVSG